MKINQHVNVWSSYNTKIFKISAGFLSKLKLYNSLNSALGRACLYDNFCACQLYLKMPSGNQNIDFFDNLYGAILCDSHYGVGGLARGVSVLNFAISRRFISFVAFCFKPEARIQIRCLDVTNSCSSPCGVRNCVSSSRRLPSCPKYFFFCQNTCVWVFFLHRCEHAHSTG